MKFILDYWGQIVLLLSVIGYFTTKFIEIKIKRNEIKYSLFHKEKTEQLMKFYNQWIAFDAISFKIASKIKKISVSEYNELFDEINMAYESLSAVVLPFRFLATPKEYAKIEKMSTVCHDFVTGIDPRKLIDTEIVQNAHKDYRREVHPLIGEMSSYFRHNIISQS